MYKIHHSAFLVTGTLIAGTPIGVIITLDVKKKLKMEKIGDENERTNDEGIGGNRMTLVDVVIRAMADCKAPAWSQYPRR